MISAEEDKPPILHILVVGFHHKLGCQVEFSYPPLIVGSSGKNECPSGWKYLPTLALPDGSHNFSEDAVYFNVPSLTEPTESVYGISCYRQIPVEKLKIRTADVTRSTVQKSVCILSRLPIYGYIEVKLSLIADAFFDQGDFSCTDILVKAYHQLNACLLDNESRRPLRHFYVGLPLREIVLHWRHKTLILYKLFLLQRKVVCYGSPVRAMCTLILGIASLIPRLLEKGFQEVACVRTSRPLSPMPDFTDSLQREAAALHQEENQQQQRSAEANKGSPETASCVEAIGSAESITITSHRHRVGSGESSSQSSLHSKTEELEHEEYCGEAGANSSLSRETSVDSLISTLRTLCMVNPDEYRAPISIFASGNLCLPYLSLPYMDLLSDPSVLSYVIGTSNILFQQKRQLSDVLIDIENAHIEAYDAELRRQLSLSTEDLRFMDFLLKHVQSPKEDAEGSEHWIREQFQGYILSLLRSAVTNDSTSKDNDPFNAHFMHAFKRTQCYQEWYDVRPEAEFFEALPAGHPFAGTLSVADMKLKIAQTMQNSESGRKLNQAVNNTSRAVGGAITQAKGAFSSWWSSITTTVPIVINNINARNENEDAEGNSASNAIPEAKAQQSPQDIKVSFQNRSLDDNAPEGVSIHMALEEEIEGISNGNSKGDPLRSVDSADELEENGFKNETDKSLPQAEELGDTLKEPMKGSGIVEIGREAEMLDKTEAAAAGISRPASCGTDAASNASGSDHSKGGSNIFIV